MTLLVLGLVILNLDCSSDRSKSKCVLLLLRFLKLVSLTSLSRFYFKIPSRSTCAISLSFFSFAVFVLCFVEESLTFSLNVPFSVVLGCYCYFVVADGGLHHDDLLSVAIVLRCRRFLPLSLILSLISVFAVVVRRYHSWKGLDAVIIFFFTLAPLPSDSPFARLRRQVVESCC